jgi:hypothetical protein
MLEVSFDQTVLSADSIFMLDNELVEQNEEGVWRSEFQETPSEPTGDIYFSTHTDNSMSFFGQIGQKIEPESLEPSSLIDISSISPVQNDIEAMKQECFFSDLDSIGALDDSFDDATSMAGFFDDFGGLSSVDMELNSRYCGEGLEDATLEPEE